jgi:putative flippase GtrA
MLDTPAGSCQHLPPVASPVILTPPSLALRCNLALRRTFLAHGGRARLLCFARTMLVGFWANVLDFALLALCLRWLHVAPLPSRVIALLLSGLITFIGIRSFAFRVKGGNVPQQAGRFIIAELAALPLNLLSFQLCALSAPLAAPEVVSFVANGLVFIAFSYPVRRLLVFGGAVTSGAAPSAAATSSLLS